MKNLIKKSEFPLVEAPPLETPKFTEAPPLGETVSKSNYSSQPKSVNIIKMQKALIDLYKTIQSNMELAHGEAPRSKPYTGKNMDKTPAGSQGSDPFVDFMVDNYSKEAPMSGKQMSATDVTSPQIAKDRMDMAADQAHFTDLKTLLSSLQIVGQHTSQGEMLPDGAWGPHTQNALQNTYNFAWSLIKFQEDLKKTGGANIVESKFYDSKASNTLRTYIEKGYKSKDADHYAGEITKLIQSISNFYMDFRKKFMQDTQYGKEIRQDSSFPTATKATTTTKVPSIEEAFKTQFGDQLIESGKSHLQTSDDGRTVKYDSKIPASEYMKERFDVLKNTSIPNVSIPQDLSGQKGKVEVPLYALESAPALKSFLDKNNITINGKPASADRQSLMYVINLLNGQL